MTRARRWLALLTAAIAGQADPAGGEEEAREARLAELRERMVSEQIEARGVRDPRVLEALRRVPRHRFAPGLPPEAAYRDAAHAIGHGQTISQPYVVALMTELADVQPGERVLEVGTGSGYQAAVLAALGAEVYTIEIVAPLARQAAAALREAGAEKVFTRHGDGYRGWPEAAPFDAVVVTAAAPRIPQPLVDQLAVGGRMVIPVDRPDGTAQDLVVLRRTADGLERERSIPVVFVPMTGEVREPPDNR